MALPGGVPALMESQTQLAGSTGSGAGLVSLGGAADGVIVVGAGVAAIVVGEGADGEVVDGSDGVASLVGLAVWGVRQVVPGVGGVPVVAEFACQQIASNQTWDISRSWRMASSSEPLGRPTVT